MKPLPLIAILASALLAACTTVPGAGRQEGATPPWLVSYDSMKIWGSADSFGPVPPAQTDMGVQICAKLNTAEAKFVATGYHSRARGLDGKPLPDGGFLCVREQG
jgi:hypothetical protein